MPSDSIGTIAGKRRYELNGRNEGPTTFYPRRFAQANPALPRSKTEQKELSIPGWLSHLLGRTLQGSAEEGRQLQGVD